ncbi:MAG: hypothetical protein MJ137_02275 [Clostridia bacterium]|nr:hypothetical protein [Clostridia bacterium]
MKKNRILSFIIIAVLVALSLTFFVGANEKSISEEEGIELIKNALDAHYKVHQDGDKWWNDLESEEKRESEKYYFTGKLPEKLNTKEKMSAFFKTIYTDEIADEAWMYAWNVNGLSPEFEQLHQQDFKYPLSMDSDGKIRIYTERQDGTLDICDNISGNIWVKYKALFDSERYDCPLLFSISGNSKNGQAVVALTYHEADMSSLYLIEVKFTNTNNGWRIDDSQFFRALHGNHKDSLVQVPYVYELYFCLQNYMDNSKYTVDTNSMIYRTLSSEQTVIDFDVIQTETGNRTGCSLSFENTGDKYCYYNGWKITGGSFLEYAKNQGYDAPNTGDNSLGTLLLLILICFTSFSAMFALITRNYKKI